MKNNKLTLRRIGIVSLVVFISLLFFLFVLPDYSTSVSNYLYPQVEHCDNFFGCGAHAFFYILALGPSAFCALIFLGMSLSNFSDNASLYRKRSYIILSIFALTVLAMYYFS